MAKRPRTLCADRASELDLCFLKGAANGDPESLQSLLEQKADIESCDSERRTACHLACINGHTSALSWLICNDARIDVEDRWGNTPLKYAIISRHCEIVQLFVTLGDRHSGRDLEYLICQGAAEGNLDLVDLLVHVGVSLNAQNYDQRSPLHLATANGHLHVVQYLLTRNCDVSKRDRLGRMALDDAIVGGHLAIQQLLDKSNSKKSWSQAEFRQSRGNSLPNLYNSCKSSALAANEDFATLLFEKSADSRLAKYLTLKGSAVDSAICWGNQAHRTDCMETSEIESPSDSDLSSQSTIRAEHLLSLGHHSPLPAALEHQALNSMPQAERQYPPPVASAGASARAGGGDGSEAAAQPQRLQSCAASMDSIVAVDYLLACGARRLSHPNLNGTGADRNSDHNNNGSPDPALSLADPSPFFHHTPLCGTASDGIRVDLQVADAAAAATAGGRHGGDAAAADVRAPPARRRRHSLQLNARTERELTVIFVDIKGFTAGCAAMTAQQVGDWVSQFYARVDLAAAAHGVQKVEVRGDCCICVSGDAAGGRGGAGDAGGGQVTRALAFATALHAELQSLAAGRGRRTSARMGMATGDVAFLLGGGDTSAAAGGGGGSADSGGEGGSVECFVSIQGDTVNLAARMEAMSGPGTAVLHKSAADKWAAENGRAGPRTACVEVKGRGLQRAAVYDCAGGGFDQGTLLHALLPEASLRSLSGLTLPPALRRSLGL